MEFAAYGDCSDLFEQVASFHTEKLVRTYFQQIVEAVDYIHEHGYAHLDLKMDNLLIGEGY